MNAASTLTRSDLAQARLEQAYAYIQQHLADPGLNADRLAAALCMSRRALYKLFAEQDSTPTRLIVELRLARCRTLIEDPRHGGKIAAIALDHGFRHYSSFCRLFKARYGLSPSAARAGAG